MLHQHFACRLEHLINSQFKHIIKHPWYQTFQNAGRLFQTRIGIHLDQERVKVFVEEKVKAKQFEASLSLLRIQLLPYRQKSYPGDILHPLEHISIKICLKPLFARFLIRFHVLSEKVERQLISVFVLSIIKCILLNRIIGQMYKIVVEIVKIEVVFGA